MDFRCTYVCSVFLQIRSWTLLLDLKKVNEKVALRLLKWLSYFITSGGFCDRCENKVHFSKEAFLYINWTSISSSSYLPLCFSYWTFLLFLKLWIKRSYKSTWIPFSFFHSLPVIVFVCFFFLNHSVSFISPCPGSMPIFSFTAAVSSSPLQPSGPFLSSLIPGSQPLPTRPWFHQHLHKISSPSFQFSLQPQHKQSIFFPLWFR